jgi:hypothetical protein
MEENGIQAFNICTYTLSSGTMNAVRTGFYWDICHFLAS